MTKENNTEQESFDVDQLVKKLYELDSEIAQLKHEINQGQKEVRQIEKSQTYQLSQKLKRNGKDDTNEEKTEKRQIDELKSRLYTLQSELHQLRADDRKLNTYQIMQTLTDEHQRGNLINYTEKLIEQKLTHDENYDNMFNHIVRLFNQKDYKMYQSFVYRKLLEVMPTEAVPEILVRSAFNEEPLSLKGVASFRGSLTQRVRQLQLSGTLPEYELDEQDKGLALIDALEIDRPETSSRAFSIETLTIKENTVIKPLDGAGARGVYLVHNKNDIVDLKRNEAVPNIDELKSRMKDDLNRGWVQKDEWIYEALVYENRSKKFPARDLKFYSFYGKCPLILEIIRYPELQYCWWTKDGKRISTGKYDDQLFEGEGVTEEQLATAEKISQAIPAPFIRIDFLKGEDGILFGEFAAKPGNYDTFDKETDSWLGDYFVEAEGRLVQDLLNGKSFDVYRRVMEGNMRRQT